MVDANGNQVYASYVSGSGTASATFVYTVQDGDDVWKCTELPLQVPI